MADLADLADQAPAAGIGLALPGTRPKSLLFLTKERLFREMRELAEASYRGI